MIDLNDVPQPPPRYDLNAIRERLCATAADWLPMYFPHGRMSADRKTLRCADLSGRAPRGEGSCVIHLRGPRAGWGFDHATGESAGPIDLIHHSTGVSGVAVFDVAAREARLEQRASTAPRLPIVDHSREIARIIASCKPIAGTAAERYLAHRGLSDPRCPDLLFNDDLADFDTKRGWCGMVAIVRDGAGELVGGIHRTYLLDDGSAKAPPGKKMLGTIAGGSVRLAPIGDDGYLGIAEGIETALSAQVIFNVPTWSALSADGLRRWQWPQGLKRVTIFADAGTAGTRAAADLAERLKNNGIATEVLSPLRGDDFNDDVRHGITKDDYTGLLASNAAPIALTTIPEFERSISGLSKPPDLGVLGFVLDQLVQARMEPLAERQLLGSIKSKTGIPIAILDKQLGELRRRLNMTGDLHEPPTRARWSCQLRRDFAGVPERNEANVITALSNDEALAGALLFDEFRQEIVVARSLPWSASTSPTNRVWGDADDVRCAEWLQRREINVSPAIVSRSVAAVSRDILVHPVREYLNSVRWDGHPRLEAWTLRYLGAADTPLNRAFGSRWMISAVARVMRPGVKADHMLILEGPQGAKKSSALKVLAGDWFTDELPEIGSKDAAQQMRGVWIIEIAELDAISRTEVSRIKAFLTRTTDRYRPPYERYVVTVPRQCVFAGSVNPDTYLRDETGNRRFWPVRCGDIDLDALLRDRDQLWAEAASLYRTGAVWWLQEAELIALAKGEQAKRYQEDAWDARIERWLSYERKRVNRGYGAYEDWCEEETERATLLTDASVGEILEGALGIEPARWTRADQMRVSAYLKANAWERYQYRIGTGRNSLREWRYRRTASTDVS